MYRTTEYDNRFPFAWCKRKTSITLKILEGNEWMLCINNEHPFIINKNDEYFIPKMTYYRLIPGIDKLKLAIIESVDEVL